MRHLFNAVRLAFLIPVTLVTAAYGAVFGGNPLTKNAWGRFAVLAGASALGVGAFVGLLAGGASSLFGGPGALVGSVAATLAYFGTCYRFSNGDR